MMNTVAQSLPMSIVTSRDLARARWATRAQFVVLGIVSGAWGAHVPSLKQHYALTEVSLAMTLLAVAIGVLFSLFFVGRIVARLSARISALLGGVLLCGALSCIHSARCSGVIAAHCCFRVSRCAGVISRMAW